MRGVTRAAAAVGFAAVVGLLVTAGALAGDGNGKRDKLAFADSRQAPKALKVLNQRAAALSTNPPAAAVALKDTLGAEGIVKLDPLTGTARFVGRTDGFLTGPSSAAAGDVALGYVRSNAAALGLAADGLAALKQVRDYVDIGGTHHISYTQQINGISVFGNGLKVNVTKDGRVVNVVGSPIASAAGAPGATPGITASEAVASARADVSFAVIPAASAPASSGAAQDTEFKTGDQAKLVYFKTLDGLTLAWQTIVTEGDMYQSIVDAASAKILWRQSLTDYANGLVWDNRPGAAAGGTQHTVDLAQWGNFGGTTRLFSNNSLATTDINGDNVRQASENVVPAAYTFTAFTVALTSPCTAAYPCSWNSHLFDGDFSFETNRKQNAVQAFYFVNNFHDHLAAAPIGFTEAAGNFQLQNPSGQGFGGDPVLTEADDGANTLCAPCGAYGMPDPNHTDNANMNTPPDGFAPRMQMYLFNDPLTEFFGDDDPFIQANGGDDASVVYHEYTHGLSNRLVVDADGNSTLGNIQAGSMGEAWSDWYALDYLASQSLIVDVPNKADVLEGDYVSGGDDLIRTEASDCKVGTSNGDPMCDGDARGTAGTGGYTYGDFGKIIGRPEVHADGEIWTQTLWDLRDLIGSAASESLVTRAMELAPSNPSFLDMRNSILQADQIQGGSRHDAIWGVFAHRGMGYFSAASDGDDTRPVEDFTTPPTGVKFGKLVGKVTDADTGAPIVGATVAFGGHASGFADDIAAVTNEDGLYDIKRILVGTYPKVRASAPGYDAVTQSVVIVESKANRLDWKLRRNWASLFGGGSIVDFNGPDYGPACPPDGAIDDSQGRGWGSDTDHDALVTGLATDKFIVIKLPRAVNISAISVDPSNTCGDPGSSSTRGYRIESSTDGVTFSEISEGTFGVANRNLLNPVTVSGQLSGVKFLRFWMLNPQVPNSATNAPDDDSGVAAHCGPGKDNGFGGCQFMDMSEIKVYGLGA